MKVFAIGDLHISSDQTKPMDIFGKHWENHYAKIALSWKNQVKENDVVLIPGDISWAMKFEDGIKDLTQIGQLPGKKVMIRGNHDYWWGSIGKLRESLPKGMYVIQNDSLEISEISFVGTRGWNLPQTPEFTQKDQKIFQRELLRMEMSLIDGRKKNPEGKMIALIHYPPLNEKGESTLFTELFEKYKVNQVVYGHLHGQAIKNGFVGVKNQVEYYLVSSDSLNFTLKELETIEQRIKL